MNHDPEYHDRLDQLIDLELKRLPEPQVPEALLQRVLAAIAEDQRTPWWQKPWVCWPLTVQIFFLTSLLALAGTLAYALSAASADFSMQWISARFSGVIGIFARTATVFATLANAFMLVLTAVSKSWLVMVGAATAMLYVFSVALGIAWFRVALNRRAFNFKLL